MSIGGASLGIEALHWLRPQWLWGLLALPLLAWWWRARLRQRNVWRDVVDPHLLPYLLDDTPGRRGRRRPWLGLIGAGLVVCALAGPAWQRVEQPLWQARAPLVIALDLSSASLASDLPPSRLLQARAKVATLLRARAGGQVGLVAFADDAYTVAPLTEDAANVALFLDALEPGIMPVDGSRADRAIAWSARLLKQAGFEHGDILLLTDHADARGRDAAASAAHDGYRVSSLGLGTGTGAAYRDGDGRIAQAHLDAGSLRTLASAGDGAYAELGAGDRDLASLGVLESHQPGSAATHGEKTAIWLDQGYWLLLPLMLLALAAFRREGVLAMVLVCACLPLQPARAANSWWLRPDQQAYARMEQGARAYRGNDFAAAQRQWNGVPGADAAYNRGNALAKQGDYDAAIAAYDRALRLQPDMDDAIANRKAVEAAKQRKPPPGQQQGNRNAQKRPGQTGQEGNQANPQPGTRSRGQTPPPPSQSQSASPPPSTPARQAPQQPDKPADPKAQREADAAQRQRMQQALQQMGKRNGSEKPVQSQRGETPAQRERRLANEAWLSRVPDDPGGLLRAKFRLEYERRQQGGN